MFITDAQTLKDTGLFERGGVVNDLYHHTATRGGAAVLDEFLACPLSDAGKINQRTGIARHFLAMGTVFPFERECFDAVEQYLADRDERSRLTTDQQGFAQKITGLVAADTQYKTIVKGIASLMEILQQLQHFYNSEDVVDNKDYAVERESIHKLLTQIDLNKIAPVKRKHKLSHDEFVAADSILRFRHYGEVRKLLQYIYRLDAYLCIGKVSLTQGFCFARALDLAAANETVLRIEAVKHPAVAGAKGNDLTMDGTQNIVFLTGANMAGKSTFMKSVGIAVYLAHVGFPVAAAKMEFTALDGLFTTINLPDNLGAGASHFYAEVLRVKKVAQELHNGKRLMVLFDELFRGTNVKDAGEATIEVIEGFAKRRNSLFIISTHIIEAGEVLKQRVHNINYRYLPTRMEGNKPVYTYRLEPGITEDRHGMVIIRNEGILEMLVHEER